MNVAGALAVAIPLAFSASLAVAQQAPEAGKKAARPRQEQKAPAGQGLVVFVDPVTGQIRQPDAAEIGSLVSPAEAPGVAAQVAEKPLVMKYGPGEAVGVVLDERFESFMVVTKTPDGKLAMSCVEGKKKADAAVVSRGKADAGKADAR